tara:strand:+ start:191 stop:763 length:573 start_codon:yes stop_codon:yes gene_type:complete
LVKKNSHWKYPEFIDIYTVKGEVDLFFKNIGVSDIDYVYLDNKIIFESNSNYIAEINILNKDILKQYEIKEDVIAFTLSIDSIKKILDNKSIKYKRVSQYPGIRRDISVSVPNNLDNITLEKDIYDKGGKYLKNVTLFDFYLEEKDNGKKSLAYSLEFKSDTRTLKDLEINDQMNKIINSLIKKFNVLQR